MKKIFCTFADSRLNKSLKRIYKQARAMGCYDEIIINNELNLDPEFKKKFEDKLKPNVRGYGYWIWKPQIILQALSKANDGDLIQYTDAGCWLNPKGKARLDEYFDIVNNERLGVLAFECKPYNDDSVQKKFELPEYKWTKGDLFDYFKVRDNDSIAQRGQIGAGIIFLKKCKFSENLINQWLGVYLNDYFLADDSESNSINFTGFIEHKHDQSIFSLLCKINNVKTLSAFEYWYPSKDNIWIPNWKMLDNYPILAKRDKDFSFLNKIKRLINKISKIG